MRKVTLFIVIMSFSIIENLCAQNYHVYDFEMVKEFSVGDENDQLGVFFPNYEIGVNGPSGLGFKSEGECIILDHINEKLKYYTSNWIYSGDKENTSLPVLVRVEDLDNNFAIVYGRRFQSFNSSKEKIIDVEFSLELSNEKFQYFPISNLLLISKNETLLSILNPGPDPDENNRNILNQEQTLALFNEPEKYGLEGNTIDDRNRIFIDGELQTRDYKTYIEYWMSLNKSKTPPSNHFEVPWDLSNVRNISFCGTDISGNYYWDLNLYMYVFNSEGWLIDLFKYDSMKSKTQPAIHPSGDVYFLDYDIEGVYVYRIQNVWDPEGRADWYAEQEDANKTGILNDSRVRIRDFPNLEGNHLGYLNKDQRVEIIGQTSTEEQIGEMSSVWYKVRTEEGLEGWAYGWFIDLE